MGNPSIEVSEENHGASQEDKSQAMEAISEGTLISLAIQGNECMYVNSKHPFA